ncbi:hypothetical protein OTU49_001839 [Cherax quadricarinatus]|uniref:Uncharacterized protein n=1 Tax=Cherax quadricarinatus TaxID=27406 RepID=A0AAW0XT52_CHEQU
MPSYSGVPRTPKHDMCNSDVPVRIALYRCSTIECTGMPIQHTHTHTLNILPGMFISLTIITTAYIFITSYNLTGENSDMYGKTKRASGRVQKRLSRHGDQVSV